MIKKEWIPYIIVGVIILIVLGMRETLPKQAPEDVNGMPCLEDDDCPCWGTYNVSGQPEQESFGIGIANCINCDLTKNLNRTSCIKATTTWACDTTYCFDVEPVEEWWRENPWQWLKDNTMITVGIIALLLLVLFWPKR